MLNCDEGDDVQRAVRNSGYPISNIPQTFRNAERPASVDWPQAAVTWPFDPPSSCCRKPLPDESPLKMQGTLESCFITCYTADLGRLVVCWTGDGHTVTGTWASSVYFHLRKYSVHIQVWTQVWLHTHGLSEVGCNAAATFGCWSSAETDNNLKGKPAQMSDTITPPPPQSASQNILIPFQGEILHKCWTGPYH